MTALDDIEPDAALLARATRERGETGYPSNKVRPFVLELEARGNVTASEWAVPMNSYERHLLIPKLELDVFLEQMEHTIENCDPVRFRPPHPIPTTYDEALACTYGPEVIRRMRTQSERLKRAAACISKLDAGVLRAVMHNWRSVDEVTVLNPGLIAEQLLCALDALAIVQEFEHEAQGADEGLAKAFGAPLRRA